MKNFQARRRLRQFVYSWPVVIIFLIILILLARATWSAYAKYSFSDDKRKEAERSLDTLLARKSALTADIINLRTPRGIERAIRSKFEVVLPGEEVFVIVDEEASSSQAQRPTMSWWRRLFGK